jgi:hypothetical protein
VTGDLNIPRSEISWIVPDTRSPLRVCDEEEFRSALSYEALGHVAYQGYTGNRMIPAERESTLYDKMLIANQKIPLTKILFLSLCLSLSYCC